MGRRFAREGGAFTIITARERGICWLAITGSVWMLALSRHAVMEHCSTIYVKCNCYCLDSMTLYVCELRTTRGQMRGEARRGERVLVADMAMQKNEHVDACRDSQEYGDATSFR